MKPIIFNTEMVKAILSGQKVSTRRPLKKQPSSHHWDVFDTYKLKHNMLETQKGLFCCFRHVAEVKGQLLRDEDIDVKAPYQKGDTLYIRETWKTYKKAKGSGNSFHISEYKAYRADEDNPSINKPSEYYDSKWKPSIHMPKDVARLFLKVTDVRVERVNQIDNQGCINEGIPMQKDRPRLHAFKELWNSLYSNWNKNPWVWVIDFEVIKK